MKTKIINICAGAVVGISLYFLSMKMISDGGFNLVGKLCAFYFASVPSLISVFLGSAHGPIPLIGGTVWLFVGGFVGFLISLRQHAIYKLAVIFGFSLLWIALSLVSMFLVAVFIAS